MLTEALLLGGFSSDSLGEKESGVAGLEVKIFSVLLSVSSGGGGVGGDSFTFTTAGKEATVNCSFVRADLILLAPHVKRRRVDSEMIWGNSDKILITSISALLRLS